MHTKSDSQVIVMLDEDETGRAGREDIAVRLSKFVFVKIHAFEKEGMQPEQLSAEVAGFGGRCQMKCYVGRRIGHAVDVAVDGIPSSNLASISGITQPHRF